MNEREALAINERHIPLAELDPGLVAELGPADASLIELWRQLHREGRRPVIVTLDRPLQGRCRALEIAAEHPAETLAAFIAEE